LLISEVKKKKKLAEGGKSKGKRVQKDLRARGEDFGQAGGTVAGVADELCQLRQNINYC
jgi:hypothetical protein